MKANLFPLIAMIIMAVGTSVFADGFANFGTGNSYYYGAAAPYYVAPALPPPGGPFSAGNPGAGILGYDYGGLYSRNWIGTYGLPSPSGVFGPYTGGAYGGVPAYGAYYGGYRGGYYTGSYVFPY